MALDLSTKIRKNIARMVLSVHLLQQSVSVEVDADVVEAL
jgi:hypothetical protein